MAKRRSYTKEERDAVLADVPALGINEAARKHGVPQTTLTRWAQSAGVRREGVPSVPRGRRAKTGTSKGGARRTREQGQPADGAPAAAPAAPKEPAAETSGSKTLAEATAAPPSRRTLKPRAAKLYTPSQKAEVLEHAAEHGVTEASKKFSVSRFSIYGWQRKVSNAAVGNGPSPTAGPAPKEIDAQRDKEILDEWHRHPGLGPSQIRNQLRRKSIRVSVNTVRRVMEGAGYRPPKVERKVHDQRYEATRPNHLWHLDFVQRNIHRANTFTLILIDDYSRYVVGHGVDEGGERADFVIAAFEEAVARHGRPEMVMHDKGAAFWSWKGVSRFTALLTELGIDPIEAEHKEWNGKVEVFNANLHKELFDAHRFYDLAEMRRRLAAHLHWYNHARTHHALGGLLVPADRYYGRVDEVLARIEAGAGRDAGDLLDLRDRCLELFKVTSKGGVAEVWLLGQRLLELPTGARP
jgi:transposase InsO family protein